jgi:hypothetical protein
MVTEFLVLVKRKNTIQSVNLKRQTLHMGVVERGGTKRGRAPDLKIPREDRGRHARRTVQNIILLFKTAGNAFNSGQRY